VVETKAEWFIPGRDRKPAGPYTVEQVLRALRIGRVTRQTICWREGMADWLPIEQIPAFAHLLQPVQTQRGLIRFHCSCGNEIIMSHKFSGKQAKCSGCGAVVTVPAPVGNESAGKPKPKPKRSFVSKLIVLLVLAGLGAGAYFFVVADYLKLRKAEELIKKESYSKASRELKGPDKSFLFKNQALYLDGLIEVYEFASAEEPHEITVGKILQGENPLSRAQRSLKKACKAEPKCKELAKDDLAEAVEKIPAETNDRLSRILAINLLRKELDAADSKQLAREVVEALKGNVDFQQRFPYHKSLVTLLLDWDGSLMSELLSAILPEDAAATLLYFRNLRTLYNWAQEKPELQDALPDAILTSVKTQLESDQPQDAVGILDNSLGYLPEEKKPAAADLYLQAAKKPKSSDRSKVLSMLVVDATAVGNQQSYFRRTPIAPYLDAALPAAAELLAKYPQTPELDRGIQDLARTLHKNKRQEEALNLAKSLLEKIPNTLLKSDIEMDIQKWGQSPSKTTPTTANKVPSSTTYGPVSPTPTPTNPPPTTISPTTPPTSTTPPTPKKNEPALVKNAAELEEALKNADKQKVMWIRLAGRNITPDQKRRLQFWVANGGVLWLETDLVKTFRFPNLRSTPRNLTQGRARVYQAKHSVLQGIGGAQVSFEVEPGQVGIAMLGRFNPPKGIIPLIVIETAQNEYTAIGAVKAYQKGYVILRPAKIMTDTQPGKKFDQNLRNFSFNPPKKTTQGYRPAP